MGQQGWGNEKSDVEPVLYRGLLKQSGEWLLSSVIPNGPREQSQNLCYL